MGARVKRISILLALTLLAPNLANAATPTPAKSPSKSPSPTAKTSAKPTVSSTSKVTAKPTVKATTKKKIVYKPRPKVSLSPSPTPKWPPAGFQSDKTTPDIYAKFPTRKELIGYTTPSTKTAAQLRTQLVT